MKSIALVGHGPSMLHMQAGKHIDEHDIVIRFKWHRQLTEDPARFGNRTDIVCCSLKVAPAVQQHWPDVQQFFVFSDSRTQDIGQERLQSIANSFGQKTVAIDKPLCDFWDAHYRRLRDEMGGPGHDHTSAGTHCLMYVGKYLAPCQVTLFGFDSVVSGQWDWSVTRGPDWEHYPDHRFDVENRMLPDLAAVYQMMITGYMPDEISQKASCH